MGLFNANAALITAYQSADLGLKTAFDNLEDFTPPDEMWAQVNFKSDDNRAVTLGDDGEDEFTGYLQVVLYGVRGEGIAQFLNVIDKLQKTFKNGRSFEYEGLFVTILRSRTPPAPSINGIPVRVFQTFWRIRVPRS